MYKICTSKEQSKKLIELGIDVNTADMFWTYDFTVNDINGINVISNKLKPEENDIPCWSLSALLDVLPKYIGDYSKCLYYDVGGYYCGYMDDGNFMLTIEETNADNPIDACVEMILKLHEKDLL